jgi:hypothetical protein
LYFSPEHWASLEAKLKKQWPVVLRENHELGKDLAGHVLELDDRDLYKKYSAAKELFWELYRIQRVPEDRFSVRIVIEDAVAARIRKHSLKRIMRLSGTIITPIEGSRTQRLYHITGPHHSVAKACRNLYQSTNESGSEESVRGRVRAQLLLSPEVARYFQSKKGLLRQIEEVCGSQVTETDKGRG